MPISKNPRYKNAKNKDIDLTVFISVRPNLRDETAAYVGFSILENLFDICKVDRITTSITLIYPERWCNVVEQRAILERIKLLYPNVERVTMTTNCPQIIGEVPAICALIDSGKGYEKFDAKNLKTRACPSLDPDSGKLQIFRG